MSTVTLTSAATKNHEELFGRHESSLRKTDPEYIELFNNWAFDEVIGHSRLETRQRVLLILASTIGSHALTEYKVMLTGALNVGVTPVEIKEVVYQAVPYMGISRVIDFLHATNDFLRDRGIALPLPEQANTTAQTRLAAGLAAQTAIFGEETVSRMRSQAPADLGHIQEFLSAACFGGHYTRSGIDLKTRELLTFAYLVSLGGCEPQVKAHIGGNLRMGNDRAVLLDVVTQLLPYIGYPRSLNAIAAINELSPPAPPR